VASTSTDCFLFSSIGTASVTIPDKQKDAESSSDSLCDTEAEVDISSSGGERPNGSNAFRNICQLRKSKTVVDLKNNPWLILDTHKR